MIVQKTEPIPYYSSPAQLRAKLFFFFFPACEKGGKKRELGVPEC